MGKHKQRLIYKQCQPKADRVWARSGAKDDLLETFLELCDKTGLHHDIWKQWESASTAAPSAQFVCLLLFNFPQYSGDAMLFVPLEEFLNTWAGRLSVPKDGIACIVRMFELALITWAVPPTVVAWADGKPNGDFVCQAVSLYGDRYGKFSDSTKRFTVRTR